MIIGNSVDLSASTIGSIQSMVSRTMVQQNIPGLSVGIVQGQKLVWSSGFGYANIKTEQTTSQDRVYRVGSITKLFTATSIMQLRDQGLLHLDDPVCKYVPEFIGYGKERITIRHMLTHTSGLPREYPGDYWQSLVYPSEEDVRRSLPRLMPVFAPLQEWKYSSLAFSVLGLLIYNISRMPHDEYITRMILNPLNMTTSGFELNGNDQDKCAQGYFTCEANGFKKAPHVHTNGLSAASQLYSSVQDISKFISLQFLTGLNDQPAILCPATLAEMHRPFFMGQSWEFGISATWMLFPFQQYTSIGHSGGMHGFVTNITIIPELQLGVAVFCNAMVDSHGITTDILNKIIVPSQESESANSAISQPIKLSHYTGSYVNMDIFKISIQERNGQLIGMLPKSPLFQNMKLMPSENADIFDTAGGGFSGEPATFIRDKNGRVIGMNLGGFYYTREVDN